MKLRRLSLTLALALALAAVGYAAQHGQHNQHNQHNQQNQNNQNRPHDRHGSSHERHGADHERPGHTFGVREFDHFHDILHPLQHEALPANDYARIRAAAAELTTRGQAIVELPVPQGVHDQEEYRRELERFRAALAKYREDAAEGTNEQLRESYEAVHDHFEMLVAQLPRRPRH